MSDQADIERVRRVTAVLEGKGRWKIGKRWCEAHDTPCANEYCLREDMCNSVVVLGWSPNFAQTAHYMNLTLKRW